MLKHQLKKYISTVQELKSTSTQSVQEKEVAKKETTEKNTEKKSKDSALFEGVYEEKLVKMADLHADILEINDRLQKDLLQKDMKIQHLEEQIREIRGPVSILS